MKKGLTAALMLLRSNTLTIWFAGLFLLYYLTAALWSKEAFGSFIHNLSQNNVFRALYLVFFLNATLRILDGLRALRGRRRALLLRLPLYTGIVLFLGSSFMSVNLRQSGWQLVSAGDVVSLPGGKEQVRVLHVGSALKRKELRTADSRLFAYEPTALLGDGQRRQYEIGAFPPRKVQSAYVHVLQFGLRPGMELKRGGAVLAREYVPLNLLPYGAADTFEIEPLPYTFSVSIVPNRTIKRGRETAREYDLTRPRYAVTVVQGDRTIAREETETGLAFDRDMTLGFLAPVDWVVLDIAWDPFLPWFAASLALLAAGAALYPFSFIGGSRPGD